MTLLYSILKIPALKESEVNTIKINISPLNSRILKSHLDPVSNQLISNTDLIQSFLQLAGISNVTPVLPFNCIQYIRKNHSYIIVQEFDPIVTDVFYTISEPDIINDMNWHRKIYVERCRTRNGSRCENCEHDFCDVICCESSNCYDCDYADGLRKTIDDYYEGDELTFQNVPIPRTLFVSVLGVQKEQYFVRKCFVKALASPITASSDLVFNLPLGNLYSDSSICWGDNRFDPSPNLIFVSGVLSRFFDAPFNADLDISHPQLNSLGQSLNIPYFSTRNFLNAIQNAPHFKPEWLVLFNKDFPTMTYEEFLDRIIEMHTI